MSRKSTSVPRHLLQKEPMSVSSESANNPDTLLTSNAPRKKKLVSAVHFRIRRNVKRRSASLRSQPLMRPRT